MVKLADLVELSKKQLQTLKDGRLKTAKLYSAVLSQFSEDYVSLDNLNSVGNRMECDKFTKNDLMKMLRVNYYHTKNKKEVNNLMERYGVHDYDFKPL